MIDFKRLVTAAAKESIEGRVMDPETQYKLEVNTAVTLLIRFLNFKGVVDASEFGEWVLAHHDEIREEVKQKALDAVDEILNKTSVEDLMKSVGAEKEFEALQRMFQESK